MESPMTNADAEEAPLLTHSLVVGVTGHRKLREQDLPGIRTQVAAFLQTLQSGYPELPLVLLSSLAFGLWTILLKYNRVGLVTVFNFLVPIFGAILSAMFLGETVLEWKNLVALAFVCAGIWLVTKEPRPALPQACPKPC